MKKYSAILLSALAILALVVFVALHFHLRVAGLEDRLPRAAGGGRAAGDGKSLTVRRRPVSKSITLTGHVGPGRIENLPAPFSATVKKVSFAYNASVAKGDVLLELDTSDIEPQLWDAENARLLARQNYEKIRDWEHGTDVRAARRELDAAQEQLTGAQRSAQETKALFDKGIVSRNEYQSSIETLHDRQRALQTAKANLDAALEKGNPENVGAAKLQLDSAQAKWDGLREKIAHAAVKAPLDGMVVLPVATGGDGGAEPRRLTPGTAVNAGDALLAVADLAGVLVETQVDEIEVNKLHVGQPATITGEAFAGLTLNGRVSRISQEALASPNASDPARYKLWVEIAELTPVQRGQMRMGMTAHLEIVIYHNPEAIVLPPAAVHGDPGQAWVLRKAAGEAAPERVAVTLGIATPDGVEVLSDLEPGDVVVLDGAAPGK